jgi:hypothetical protein
MALRLQRGPQLGIDLGDRRPGARRDAGGRGSGGTRHGGPDAAAWDTADLLERDAADREGHCPTGRVPGRGPEGRGRGAERPVDCFRHAPVDSEATNPGIRGAKDDDAGIGRRIRRLQVDNDARQTTRRAALPTFVARETTWVRGAGLRLPLTDAALSHPGTLC